MTINMKIKDNENAIYSNLLGSGNIYSSEVKASF